jgi:hypothetical protein
MWVAGLGVGERRALPGVSLTYLNAVNHFLTPWSIVEAGALALEPIPEASIRQTLIRNWHRSPVYASGQTQPPPIHCPPLEQVPERDN